MATGLAEPSRRSSQYHAHERTAVHEVARCHQAASAVVARTDGHQYAPATQLAVELDCGDLGQVRAGLFHHLQQADAEDVDRQAIDLGHLGGRDSGSCDPPAATACDRRW